MPNPTVENLASLFRSAAKFAVNRSSYATAAAAKRKKKQLKSQNSSYKSNNKKDSSSSSSDAVLKSYVTSIDCSSSDSKRLLKSFKKAPLNSNVSTSGSSSLHNIVSDSLTEKCRIEDGESAEELSKDASNLLFNELEVDWEDEDEVNESAGDVLQAPWLLEFTNNTISLRRKEVSRERKQRWVFKNTQTSRFGKLVKMCGNQLGSDTTIQVFEKLGRETGLKEYNALIKICIEKARDATDEDASLEEIYKAYQIFKQVRDDGFKIEEETYGQFLLYLIDFGMIEEFFFFHEIIQDENPDSLPRLAYYEMLLWVKVNNEEKIQELFHSAVDNGAEEKYSLREQLLLALCESDRQKEFLMLLETVDITKVISDAYLVRLFRSLGKFLLEPFAERFLLELKTNDIGSEGISKFVYEYTTSIPNLAVKDIIRRFQALHTKLEILPTSAQYERLIKYSCGFLKVHEALNLVDEAFGSGVALSLEVFHAILDACDRSCEFNLVHQINSMIHRQDLKPNNDTFRMMILQSVKMKDFEGAYGLINDLEKMDLKPTTSMYNAILSGYFREKNIQSAMNVLKQMEDADVKPDAVTFSYLISNSHCEKDIMKFLDAMNNAGVKPTKHVFMALINAYAACGQLEKAKQVVSDTTLPVKSLNEIKGVLIGALASNGQLSGALEMYEEIKQTEYKLDPKAIRCLIEHFQSDGDLDRSLQLLEELNDSPYWVDACFRIISYCIQQDNLRSTIDLLKQLENKFVGAEVEREVLFDEVFCVLAEKEAKDVHFGLSLLQAIKKELGVCPSRKSLDFLLSACVTARDSKAAFVIWKEYEMAELPYNVLSFLRMYQALLASGDTKSAAKIKNKISKDDPHVRAVIRACEETYMNYLSVETKQKKKKKRALAATLELLEELDAKT